jgi:putative transposase
VPFVLLHVLFSFFLDLICVLMRSEEDKAMELLLLRQQLRIYERKAKQPPRITRWEKVALASIAAKLPDLSPVAAVFTPATLLRWHCEIVRRKWTFANLSKPGRPRVSAACVELIVRLARENPGWGYGKVQGELRKLGHRVSVSTIKRVLRQHGLPPAPARNKSTWRAFLGHYRESILACDFFTVATLTLHTIYALFFIELGSRRVHFAGCTAAPDAAWVVQQARQFAWRLDEPPIRPVRFLLHDHDRTFPAGFDAVFASEGITIIKTPIQAPTANGVAERVVRSIREECLDRLLILNQAHLTHVLRQYLAYYNHRRPHQGLGQRPPAPATHPPPFAAAPEHVRCRLVLGGIIHDYSVAA